MYRDKKKKPKRTDRRKNTTNPNNYIELNIGEGGLVFMYPIYFCIV